MVKNTIGNRKAKEVICTTHGHELNGGECWCERWYRAERDKGKKKWDN